MDPLHSVFDDVPYPWNKAYCRNLYWREQNDHSSASTKTILCTIAIIACTILLEVVVHISFEHRGNERQYKCNEEESSLLPDYVLSPPVCEQPRRETGLRVEPWTVEAQNDTDAQASNRHGPLLPTCFASSPGQSTRAVRLFCAFFLYYLTVAAFGIRISDVAHTPTIDARCREYVQVSKANWVAVVFLNIIPFMCATFAFLRAVVDCALLYWSTGLRYGPGSGRLTWMPCMPFSIVLMFKSAEGPIAWVTRGWESLGYAAKGKGRMGDVEMHDEARGLVEDIDRSGDEIENREENDAPPAYDVVVGLKDDTRAERNSEHIVGK